MDCFRWHTCPIRYIQTFLLCNFTSILFHELLKNRITWVQQIEAGSQLIFIFSWLFSSSLFNPCLFLSSVEKFVFCLPFYAAFLTWWGGFWRPDSPAWAPDACPGRFWRISNKQWKSTAITGSQKTTQSACYILMLWELFRRTSGFFILTCRYLPLLCQTAIGSALSNQESLTVLLLNYVKLKNNTLIYTDMPQVRKCGERNIVFL